MATRNQEVAVEVVPASQPDEKTLERIIRPELNIERWSIWQPSSARTAPRPKIIVREVTLENGSKVTSKVKVHYTDEGALTTFDQRVYYALIRIWEEEGRSIGPTNFSLRRLARILKMSWGPSTHKALTSSLTRLRITPFTWEHAFFDKEKGETLRTTGDAFHILSKLHIEQWERGKVISSEQALFRFGEKILKNLYANYTRPVCLDAVLSINSEIGQLLYTHIDLKIYGEEKTKYARNTKELFFCDLALEGKTYRYPSKRKEKIEPALKELRGLRVSDGVISSTALEPTKDGKDYKIIIVKSPLPQQARGANESDEKKGPQRFSEEQEKLLAELRDHQISEKKAREIVTTYPPVKIKNQLGALSYLDKSKIKKTLAHYLIRAIEEDYELPAQYLAKLQKIEAKRRLEEMRGDAVACPFCKDSYAPGRRLVVTDKYPRGVMKDCTHDPEVEKEFKSL